MSDCYVEEDSAINELMEYAHTGPDNPDQEEANFYFALHEFKSIVEKYGIKKVIYEMDDETEERLYQYYRQFSLEEMGTPACVGCGMPSDTPKAGAGNLQGDVENTLVPWLEEEPPF
jgi:replication initiation and membrane attachment protein DnaB